MIAGCFGAVVLALGLLALAFIIGVLGVWVLALGVQLFHSFNGKRLVPKGLKDSIDKAKAEAKRKSSEKEAPVVCLEEDLRGHHGN